MILAIGEVQLAAGDRRFTLNGPAAAALEVLIDKQFRRAVTLTAPGQADAALPVPAAGWYQFRLISSAVKGDMGASFTVDGGVPAIRTTPLLGGEGSSEWAVGPLDLGAAGILLAPGAHRMTFKERGGRAGHLEYSLLVE